MYVQNNSRTSFGTLYRGGNVKALLKQGASKEFKSELRATERVIRNNNLHKKENVDVILGYTKEDGFYGVISSKEQGVPMNPASECKVSRDKGSVKHFSDWVEAWNQAYSPEELQKFRNLMNFIKSGLKS